MRGRHSEKRGVTVVSRETRMTSAVRVILDPIPVIILQEQLSDIKTIGSHCGLIIKKSYFK